MNKKFFFTFILLTFLSISFCTKVTAQGVSPASIPSQIKELDEQIYVNVNPSSPKARDDVKITLEAYGTDLTKAEITWKINGVTAQSGRGLIELDTTAGDEGTSKK